MCWNKEVSLNTFLFSGFVLLLIIYNNKYTKYKTLELDNFWIYLFLATIILVQLDEYFIWKYIKNSYYNTFYTIIIQSIFFIQPVISLMILNNKNLRNLLICIYLIVMIPFATYIFFTKRMYAEVSSKGHLSYNNYLNAYPMIFFFWVCLFLFSFFYNRTYQGFLFGLITFLVIFYNYQEDKSIASMWCWIVNSVMIYYAARLLFYLPFLENQNLC
jgi:hypothetical protein